ncbi:hypothetical protein GBAR_LOCUS17566 [Geodia barretti]|nr:hypothetical protein GBAR_LOCUS17566 [Geodia barretti]
MIGNVRFLLDSPTLTLSPLGKLVLELQESSLLDLFLHLLKRHKMTFDDLCTLLKTKDSTDLAQEHALKRFVEMIVLDRSKVISKTTTMQAVLILVEMLFARLSTTETTVSSRKQTPFVMRGTRHRWLDNVVPFGSGGGGGVWEEGEEGNGVTVETTGRRKHDYRLNDLLQLQTVLCSSHMTETVATRVNELLTPLNPVKEDGEGEGGAFVYQISLQMLSWPCVGRKKEACQLCLRHNPGAVIDYCTTMFPGDLDLWVWLLEQLLGNANYEGDPTHPQDLYKSLYKEALGHVITLTTPREFVFLLPPTGSAGFFLPFIERSIKLHFSRATSDCLHDSILQSNNNTTQ